MLSQLITALIFVSLLAPVIRPKEKVYVLEKPDEEKEITTVYMNEERHFKLELSEGFEFYEEVAEDGTFNLSIFLEDSPIIGALSIEPLDEELSPGKYWKRMLEKDPTLQEFLVYERGATFGKTDGIQVRMEGSKTKEYFVILSMIFTSKEAGYSISCYSDSGFYDQLPEFLEEISSGFEILDDEAVILEIGSSFIDAPSS